MRIPLELNHELILPIAGGARNYWIDQIMGDGATSIVYKAHYYDSENVAHDVVVKECYPYAADIKRTGTTLTWESPDEYILATEAFCNAHKKLSSIQSNAKLKNSTVTPMEICKSNNTVYSVQHLYSGITFEQDHSHRLIDILETILALAKVVREYHLNGFLHLDIKPDNFLVLPETRQMVVLFDVDTATPIDAVETGSVHFVPYSDGWSATEQLSRRFDQLCPATDLFAIGAILFSKIVGRKLQAEDTGLFAQWDFCEKITRDVNPKALRLVRNILRKTIAASVKRRYQTAQELINALEEAVKAACEDRFIISSWLPSTVQFIGREDELSKIHHYFATGSKAVFLHGFGGMGKTELAKKYAECFSHEYDACIFQMYQPNSGLKKYVADIQINNSEDQNHEKQLKSLLHKSRVLLIVDNFDVEDDDYLEDLLALNADLLFTTRYDHSFLVSDKINILNLESLPLGQLLILFQRELGRPMSLVDLQSAQKIIKGVDNWTMIVPIIAKQIVASGKTVQEYATMMEDGFHTFNDNTEDIRTRYHGKLHRKSPMGILRYIFNVGALDEKELQALCNVSVLKYHKALTKERYQYYTGDKNLNALNSIINANWIKFDPISAVISIHPMILELIESDIKRTPSFLPGVYQYISNQFEALGRYKSIEEAESITFAMLSLTEFDYSNDTLFPLYVKLAGFIGRFYHGNLKKLHKLLFDAPVEANRVMLVDYVVSCCLSAIFSDASIDNFLAIKAMVGGYALSMYSGEKAYIYNVLPNGYEEIEDEESAKEWWDALNKYLITYASICDDSRLDIHENIATDKPWRLNLSEHPESYEYFHFILVGLKASIAFSKEWGFEPFEGAFELLEKVIIQIEESLGRFCCPGLPHDTLLEYEPPSSAEDYNSQLCAYKASHYSKKAQDWYRSLDYAICNTDEPFQAYKGVLSVDSGITRSQSGALVKNNFATRLLFDDRLTGEQKRYLSVEFCSIQVDMLRRKYHRRRTKMIDLAKSHKSMLTLYAQLLSGTEMFLSEVYTSTTAEQVRINIYRAAFILKRILNIEILDPKPYIFEDIVPNNIEWLSDFLELTDWTRTSGYVKQSQQMKHRLLDCCLSLDYSNISEGLIQHILNKLEPLAKNYKRQDVLEKLQEQHTTRRSFFVDLIANPQYTALQKLRIANDLTDEFLWLISDYYNDKATLSESAFQDEMIYHSAECRHFLELFQSMYSLMVAHYPEKLPCWTRICAAITIPDSKFSKESMLFLEDCQSRLNHIIRYGEHGKYGDTTEVDGLVYLIYENANLDYLKIESESIFLDLSELAEYEKEHIATLIQNIHRLRPETKAFLRIE